MKDDKTENVCNILMKVSNALKTIAEGGDIFTKAQLDEAWNKGLNEALLHGPKGSDWEKAEKALASAGYVLSPEGEWIAPPKDEVSQAPGYNILRDIAVADAIRRATMNGIVLTDARLMTIIAGLP